MTERNDEVAAIVLAAGRSSRMGAFKPLLPFGSTTVIESNINAIRSGGVASVVVVVGADQSAAALRVQLRNLDIVFAVNPDPESPMSTSIAVGVAAVSLNMKAVVINPVDHAAVPPEVVSTLIRAWQAGAVLVKPVTSERGGHPVLIDLSFRDKLLSLDPVQGLKGLFDAHKSQLTRVAVESNFIARDMDTWDDYRALHEDVFGVPPPEKPI